MSQVRFPWLYLAFQPQARASGDLLQLFGENRLLQNVNNLCHYELIKSAGGTAAILIFLVPGDFSKQLSV